MILMAVTIIVESLREEELFLLEEVSHFTVMEIHIKVIIQVYEIRKVCQKEEEPLGKGK